MKRSFGVTLIGGLIAYWGVASVFLWLDHQYSPFGVVAAGSPENSLQRAINLAYVVMTLVTAAALLGHRPWALRVYVAWGGMMLLDLATDVAGEPLMAVVAILGLYATLCFAVGLYLRSALGPAV